MTTGYTNRAEQVEPRDRGEMREQLVGHKAENALAFQTRAIKEFGPVAGIFLRQLLFWEGRGECPDGFIYKTEDEWFEETGLKRTNLRTARKNLKKRGVLEEKLRKPRPWKSRVLHYRLNLAVLMEIIGPYLEPGTDGGDQKAESAPTRRQKVPSPRSSEENFRRVPLTGGADAPPEEMDSSDFDGSRNLEETCVSASELVRDLERRLGKEGCPLDADQKQRYGVHLKSQGEKGATAGELQKTVDRILEAWQGRGRLLTVAQALADVRGERVDKDNGSRPEVIEAISRDEDLRYFVELAEEWDPLSGNEPDYRLLKKHGLVDLTYRYHILPQLESVAIRAVREARESHEDGLKRPATVPKGVDHQASSEGAEKPPKRRSSQEIMDDEAEAVLRDPETGPGRLLAACREGKTLRCGELTAEHIAQRVAEDIGSGLLDLSHLHVVERLLAEQ